MSSELELLKQRITELEAENTELRKENTEIPYLRNKLSVSDAEIAELKRSNIEFLRANEEYNERRDAENAKLRAGIVELKSENAELRDRVTKVEQNQLQNDSAEGTQGKGNITPNNNPSNFNLGAVHHEKPLEEKEMDNFLLEAHKKIVSSEIKQRNKERQADRKKLSKAEQASLNQDQESDTGCSTSEKIPEVLNPVTKISARAPGQNSHRKKGAENIVQLIADGIKDDAQSSNKTIPCDVISIESLDQNSSTDSLLSLAQLFDKADDAEYGAIRANQEEILRNMVRISAGGPGQNHVTKNPETRERIINAPPALESTEVNTSASVSSASQSKPDHSYFRNKILDQYPNFIKCEQREIEIVA